MATNKKKLLITQSMSKVGLDLFKERGDIEAVQFPNTITTRYRRGVLGRGWYHSWERSLEVEPDAGHRAETGLIDSQSNRPSTQSNYPMIGP